LKKPDGIDLFILLEQGGGQGKEKKPIGKAESPPGSLRKGKKYK